MRPQLELLLFSIALYIIYTAINRWRLYVSRRAFATKNGCKEPRCRVPLKDPFLAIDFVWKTLQNARKDRYLEGTHERFQLYGTTFAAKHMNYHTIHTNDHQNVKQILAARFEDFKLSSFRVDAMTPLFGKGIFTTNNDMWSHSRALLRPSFARHNMVDHLPILESHFEQLMKVIPKGGATVDLQKIFFAFTMDAATQFLFGHSVDTLQTMQEGSTTATDTSDADFVKAYT